MILCGFVHPLQPDKLISSYLIRSRKTASSYRELEERKQRLQKLEKLYADMALQKELRKPGRKRKLREDEMENPTSQPVYKWRAQRKR
ncbi:hypothetical protein PR202_gb04458 [Eleusine coracana subsp. coracana]|uniref:U3 small nucleolar RNA-associated protein 11 n=1 Tax=Eleusine coracana subsp. coracana TaxID=191504 RepID=A0AAV5E4K4_ELECO|nr:hypothetical protein PR202_gb04458 [Eleusine coracana subsp. coracana]